MNQKLGSFSELSAAPGLVVPCGDDVQLESVLAAGAAAGLPRAHAWGELLCHCRTPKVFSPVSVPKALGRQHFEEKHGVSA